MQDLWQVEGRSINIVSRYAHGDLLQMSGLAKELVALNEMVIVTGTIVGTLEVKQVTASILIVNPSMNDPVAWRVALLDQGAGDRHIE
jgi:hypothetical protein